MLNDLIDELAAVEHARWAHWQRYVHDQGERLPDGRIVLPTNLVERWERQIQTPYQELTEREKQSDRDQVRKVLPVLAQYFRIDCAR